MHVPYDRNIALDRQSSALRLDDVHVYYGSGHVLQGVSLLVHRGELVCLFGRNGAGKSTTVASIVGFVRPRRGRVMFGDVDITRWVPYRIAVAGIGLVPQGRRIFRDLTVEENLTMRAAPKRGPWSLARVYGVFPRLAERRRNMGDQLSGGEQQMLALGRALMTNPSVILMDEPSEGLAPLVVAEIGQVIQQVKGEGTSVLLVEQNLAFGLQLADRCYVMSRGAIVHECSADALANDIVIKSQYLGV